MKKEYKHFRNVMETMKHSTELHANRYDDDNLHILHIWDNEGNSYDLVLLKTLCGIEAILSSVDERCPTCKKCAKLRSERIWNVQSVNQKCMKCTVPWKEKDGGA